MGMIVRKAWTGRLLLCAALLFCILSGCGERAGNPDRVKLDPENPVVVTVWHYYNGAQLEAFSSLVDLYNHTEGKTKGILVESFSQGSVSDLEDRVIAAAGGEVGAEELPNIFASYADTAYQVDRLSPVVDLSPYLTEEERAAYIPEFLEEGRLRGDDGIRIFPVAKSVELFMLNRTDWEKFASATGADTEEFGTIEGVTDVARRYYEWTDSLTQEPEDGKAFFGRDALANYLLIGAKQLGAEIFTVEDGKASLNLDREVMRRLWDNYYIPYINGYFMASGRFRSDDIKTGDIIAFVGSSSGATFFPSEVFVSDTESYPIEVEVYPCPGFSDGGNDAVQQGAGMVVADKSKEEVYASVQFLKWLTLPENNISFSVSSGYLPVTGEANHMDAIGGALPESGERMRAILSAAVDTVNNNRLYTQKPFSNGTQARSILEHDLQDLSEADRAVVEQRIAQGMTRGEAVKEFSTDAYFDSWYESLYRKLEICMKEQENI